MKERHKPPYVHKEGSNTLMQIAFINPAGQSCSDLGINLTPKQKLLGESPRPRIWLMLRIRISALSCPELQSSMGNVSKMTVGRKKSKRTTEPE